MSATTSRIDRFLHIHSSRADAWRDLTHLAEAWARGTASRAELESAQADLAPTESYHAWPGPRLFAALAERVAADDPGGAARLARRISNALLTRSYRVHPGEWDLHEDRDDDEVVDVMPSAPDRPGARRPYFEVLFVNSQPASRWPALAAEIRRLRRPEDAFVYEPVFVGSFEDAACAAMVNPAFTSVVLAEGFPYRSRHDAPVLRSVLDPEGGRNRPTPPPCAWPRC